MAPSHRPETNPKSKIENPKWKWRRRQDSNLWYPFEVQRFSKPPLSATQPRLRITAQKPGFNSSGEANFVKDEASNPPTTLVSKALTHFRIASKIQGSLGIAQLAFQHLVSTFGRVLSITEF